MFPRWLNDACDKFRIAIQRANPTTARLVTTLVYCNAGRHRSVAAAEVIKHSVETVECLRTLPTVHPSARFNRGHCACNARSPGKDREHDARRILGLKQGATVWATVDHGGLPQQLTRIIFREHFARTRIRAAKSLATNSALLKPTSSLRVVATKSAS